MYVFFFTTKIEGYLSLKALFVIKQTQEVVANLYNYGTFSLAIRITFYGTGCTADILMMKHRF